MVPGCSPLEPAGLANRLRVLAEVLLRDVDVGLDGPAEPVPLGGLLPADRIRNEDGAPEQRHGGVVPRHPLQKVPVELQRVPLDGIPGDGKLGVGIPAEPGGHPAKLLLEKLLPHVGEVGDASDGALHEVRSPPAFCVALLLVGIELQIALLRPEALAEVGQSDGHVVLGVHRAAMAVKEEGHVGEVVPLVDDPTQVGAGLITNVRDVVELDGVRPPSVVLLDPLLGRLGKGNAFAHRALQVVGPRGLAVVNHDGDVVAPRHLVDPVNVLPVGADDCFGRELGHAWGWLTQHRRLHVDAHVLGALCLPLRLLGDDLVLRVDPETRLEANTIGC
mmetsp:Transcript_9449/g.29983  ORF Transcript_9449/g.29983 Transcript_9449/m.29983 type:complete len:333 (+) Transcript_9449:83-1081(+)